MVAWGTFVRAQEVASPETAVAGDALRSAPSPDSAQETTKDVAAPCLEPSPLLSWEDYHGPFQKVVGAFARKLELKSVHPPRYKPGTALCSLDAKDKFSLFVRDTFDPISFFEAAFNAGLDQASNRDPTFGRGRWLWETFWRRLRRADNVEVFHGFCVSNDLLGGP